MINIFLLTRCLHAPYGPRLLSLEQHGHIAGREPFLFGATCHDALRGRHLEAGASGRELGTDQGRGDGHRLLLHDAPRGAGAALSCGHLALWRGKGY